MATERMMWGLAAGLVLAGCGGGDPSAPANRVTQLTSPDEIWLAVGDEVRVDDLLRLGFAGVPADSRCPTTVVCPWQGDAAVAIHYALGTGPSYPDTLHSALEPGSVEFAGYRITLLELGPYPYAPGPIPQDDYAARLRIERAAQ